MSERPEDEPRLDPTVVVQSGARIGARTVIWAQSLVRTGAQIGADCHIGRNVYVDPGVRIGDRCKIQNNVSLYAGLTLDDEVFVGPAVAFSNDKSPRAGLSSFDVVATHVETGASLGAGSVIVCGIRIHAYAMVGAGAVVTRDVEAHSVVVGNPARRVAWVDRDGYIVSRDLDRPADDVLEQRSRR